MQIRTLVAAGAAIGAAALSLGLVTPANAATLPEPTITPTPQKFKPGQSIALAVTKCDEAPTMTSNEIFTKAPDFKAGSAAKTWDAAKADTLESLKPGKTYTTKFTCPVSEGGEKGTGNLTLTATIPPEQKFDFGRDDIRFSTTEVKPGGNVTIGVTCPSTVSSKSDSFAVAPDWKKINAAKNLWEGKGVYKQNLPKVSHLTITCEGFGSVPFTTQADGKNMGGSNGTIPSGPGPATGDGSLSSVSVVSSNGNGSSLPLVAGGSAAMLAAAGIGVVLVRRRQSVQE